MTAPRCIALAQSAHHVAYGRIAVRLKYNNSLQCGVDVPRETLHECVKYRRFQAAVPIGPAHEARRGCNEYEPHYLRRLHRRPAQRKLTAQRPSAHARARRTGGGDGLHHRIECMRHTRGGRQFDAVHAKLPRQRCRDFIPHVRSHAPTVQQHEIGTRTLDLDPHQETFSTLRSTSIRRATSSSVCAADNEMRNLAVPAGTVGGRIAGTSTPRSASAADTRMTSALSPITSGWIAVAEGISGQRRPATPAFNCSIRRASVSRRPFSRAMISRLASSAWASNGGVAVV